MPRSQAAPLMPSDIKIAVPPLDMEPVFAANQRALKAASEAQAHMISRVTKFNSELFGFVNRRLDQDRCAAKEISRCQTPQDMMSIYAKFAERAMKDYSEEIGLLAGIYADQAREALEDAQHQVEEVIEPAADAVNGENNTKEKAA
ncbi:phasin family protein [Pikeienuella piscinae]|uniref:Phasin family protein n=1 Tax=Pikeienuella piscinae TaxID=2748098 RepID=A0A7L5BWD9_9RHOB|nr:phasin family protein [Pikeienuella piscinae]QIE54194.1 phasin family protein [Pikeienuella piscinae]